MEFSQIQEERPSFSEEKEAKRLSSITFVFRISYPGKRMKVFWFFFFKKEHASLLFKRQPGARAMPRRIMAPPGRPGQTNRHGAALPAGARRATHSPRAMDQEGR